MFVICASVLIRNTFANLHSLLTESLFISESESQQTDLFTGAFFRQRQIQPCSRCKVY